MKKILVIGDSCIDKFVYGKCDRICPEAPVPVFTPIETVENGGMATNVSTNISSLEPSIQVTLHTNANVIKKTRYVDFKTNQMLVRVDENDIADRFNKESSVLDSNYDAVVISDYNKGFLSDDDIKFLIDKYPLTFIDTKKQIGDWIKGVSFIKINELEYEKNKTYLGASFKSELIVTLGEKGVRYNDTVSPPTDIVDAFDLSGAGDTFLAGLVTSYLSGKDIHRSIVFAQQCASKVISKKGVAVI